MAHCQWALKAFMYSSYLLLLYFFLHLLHCQHRTDFLSKRPCCFASVKPLALGPLLPHIQMRLLNSWTPDVAILETYVPDQFRGHRGVGCGVLKSKSVEEERRVYTSFPELVSRDNFSKLARDTSRNTCIASCEGRSYVVRWSASL
jgi:hypothetical protein